jgi:hypothetical protein
VASVWIKTRTTKDGRNRYRVEYRPGGRDTPTAFAGSFRTKRLAIVRAAWVENELAAGRMPNLAFAPGQKTSPTMKQAAERWQASRVDVAVATTVQHRTALNRALPTIGTHHVDAVSPQDIADLVASLWHSALPDQLGSLPSACRR